ncbi:Lrp/AsnC ligand binding domain-containing protein [Trueperella pecoris]|uniref:Lrp/AsnC ligand binding domain-containing protein n=1 Tax=Trueperella pecoris TaxID=2733571 RepID=UPI001C20C646|nr:Lrp/AsnC ligand binding domain-containing protein [Trueperella pecoris]
MAQALAALSSVRQVYSVTGDVDLIALVTVARHEDLATVIPDKIAKVAGVKNVKTYLAFQEFSRADLEAAFDIGLD